MLKSESIFFLYHYFTIFFQFINQNVFIILFIYILTKNNSFILNTTCFNDNQLGFKLPSEELLKQLALPNKTEMKTLRDITRTKKEKTKDVLITIIVYYFLLIFDYF